MKSIKLHYFSSEYVGRRYDIFLRKNNHIPCFGIHAPEMFLLYCKLLQCHTEEFLLYCKLLQCHPEEFLLYCKLLQCHPEEFLLYCKLLQCHPEEFLLYCKLLQCHPEEFLLYCKFLQSLLLIPVISGLLTPCGVFTIYLPSLVGRGGDGLFNNRLLIRQYRSHRIPYRLINAPCEIK